MSNRQLQQQDTVTYFSFITKTFNPSENQGCHDDYLKKKNWQIEFEAKHFQKEIQVSNLVIIKGHPH